MFRKDGKLVFLTINQDYLKELHDVCSEVRYEPQNYENKPHIGILINNNGKKYVLPLTSAKEKHKNWPISSQDRYLIYEEACKTEMSDKDIWIEIAGKTDRVYHILAALDIKKMIPVIDGTYNIIDINPDVSDSEDLKRYKHLLNKEYRFFSSYVMDKILKNVNSIYERQTRTGKVKFCCDFKALEDFADSKEKAEQQAAIKKELVTV